MNKISISQAWSYATGFFSGQGANHAILLIGVGIVVPLILQFALGGGTAMVDPMTMATGGGLMAMGAFAMVLALVNYILQMGSYFASWRIGLTNGGEPLGSALVFGLVAALPVLLLTLVVALVLGLIMFMIFGSAFMAMASGGEPSNPGSILLFIFLFFIFLLWLASRLSCTGPVMADRRTFNVLTGLIESWRMTAASQWKIFGYFILLGVALLVIFTILGMIVGVSMFAGGGVPGGGSLVGLAVGGLLMGIPIAYLQVAVPAGIYRALGGARPADVFV